MNPSEISLIAAVGVAHLGAFVALWYFGVARRFPVLATHLVVQGLAQLLDVGLGACLYRDIIWAWLQVPRMLLRGLVVWEVWHKSTATMPPMERRGLALVCTLACVLAAAIAALVLLLVPESAADAATLFQRAMLLRQYMLLGFTAWLVLLNVYLFSVRATADHNLMLYRLFSVFSMAIVFVASSFVPGGLGYRFLPWILDSWVSIHLWHCWYSLILIFVLALFVRNERNELK